MAQPHQDKNHTTLGTERGMMYEDELLLNIAAWRKKKAYSEAARLGQITQRLMEGQISPKQARFGPVADCWEQLLPAELSRHCRIDSIRAGMLEVLVDSPSYMHELRMCSPQLLEQLQLRCPRARIKEIKCTVG